MRARLQTLDDEAARTPEASAPRPSLVGPADAADAWLAMLVRLLRWPEREAGPVREELETHLRERIRDLMLAGDNEQDAVRRAVGELGEAAAVAQRYRSARRYPQRRLLMNAAMFTLTGAALGLSIVAVSGGSSTRSWQAQPEPAAARGTSPQPDDDLTRAAFKALVTRPAGEQINAEFLKAIRLDALALDWAADRRSVTLSTEASVPQPPPVRSAVYQPPERWQDLPGEPLTVEFKQTPLADVFTFLGRALGGGSRVHWAELDGAGVPRDTPINLTAKDTPLAAILRAIDEQLGEGAGGAPVIDARVTEDMLEIATTPYFDRRETELVSYDLSRLADDADAEALIGLIHTFVEPQGWRDNGGDLGELKLVGSRMFVRAPRRYHRQVEWFVQQLTAGADPHARGDSAQEQAGEPATASQPQGRFTPDLSDLRPARIAVPVLADIPLLGQMFRSQPPTLPAGAKP